MRLLRGKRSRNESFLGLLESPEGVIDKLEHMCYPHQERATHT